MTEAIMTEANSSFFEKLNSVYSPENKDTKIEIPGPQEYAEVCRGAEFEYKERIVKKHEVDAYILAGWNINTTNQEHIWKKWKNAILAMENNQKSSEVLNQEMEVGDYAILYEMTLGKGIFVPITYKIKTLNVDNRGHQSIVILIPVASIKGIPFPDHDVTMELDKIAFYHNQEVMCRELLVDHDRWQCALRKAHFENRRMELHLLAKCKQPKCNF